MRHPLLAALIAATLTPPLQAQQVATVVVQPDSLPGPQLIARNDASPLQMRGLRSESGVQLELAARDPQSCLRGVAATLAGGPVLVVEPIAAASWLPSLSIAALGSGRSSSTTAPAAAAPLPQNQPPGPPQNAAPQPSARRINLGLGVALGAALFERLRDRCESALQVKLALPADADIARLLIEVQLSPRAARPSAPATTFSFGLRAADGMLLGSAPPARPANP